MSVVIAFEAHRFRTAAAHYLKGRPAYADRLIAQVAQFSGLEPQHRVLDLGCGPGQLAAAFAPHVREVVAIDPEPEMLQRAQENVASYGNVRVARGSSQDLGPEVGPVRLVAIGRAFHWMDRAETLRRLDQIVEPGGAVALFSHKQPALPDNGWHAAFEAALAPYNQGNEFRAVRAGPDWTPHEAVLLASAFSQLTRISVLERRSTPLSHLVDRALSFSATSPGRVGDRIGQLIEAVTEALTPYATDGVLTEVIESEALIAVRPA